MILSNPASSTFSRWPTDRKPKNAGKAPADDVGDRALTHWLDQAAQADNETDRGVALEIAREIARLAGIDIDLPELDAA